MTHQTPLPKTNRLTVEYLPLAALTPNPKNPRRHSGRQIAKLSSAIQEFGFRQPIVVDAESVIVVGHTRFKAAMKLGLTPSAKTKSPVALIVEALTEKLVVPERLKRSPSSVAAPRALMSTLVAEMKLSLPIPLSKLFPA